MLLKAFSVVSLNYSSVTGLLKCIKSWTTLQKKSTGIKPGDSRLQVTLLLKNISTYCRTASAQALAVQSCWKISTWKCRNVSAKQVQLKSQEFVSQLRPSLFSRRKHAYIGPENIRNLRLSEFLENLHMKVARLSALRASWLYPSGKIPGTHFCYRLCRSQEHSAARRTSQWKITNTPFGNRTRDLPACSAVPETTASSLNPEDFYLLHIICQRSGLRICNTS
jgi:hypothetical protein